MTTNAQQPGSNPEPTPTNILRAILVDGADISVWPSAQEAAANLCQPGDSGTGYLEDGTILAFSDGPVRGSSTDVRVTTERDEPRLRTILVDALSGGTRDAALHLLSTVELVDKLQSPTRAILAPPDE